MMFETIYLIVALFGTTIAGICDLKTTNVPDQLIYGLIGSGILLHLAESLYVGSFISFYLSLEVGVSLLIFGKLLHLIIIITEINDY